METRENFPGPTRHPRQVFLSLKKYLTRQELEWLREACAPL